MLISFVSRPTPLGVTTRGIITGVALFTLGYLTALVASPVIESPLVAGSPRTVTAKQVAAEPARGRIPSSPGLVMKPDFDFDYFPDHYTNRASEVAEQSPTF
jgi:hypothetical protein